MLIKNFPFNITSNGEDCGKHVLIGRVQSVYLSATWQSAALEMWCFFPYNLKKEHISIFSHNKILHDINMD